MAYSKAAWKRARVDYESGKFKSVEDLSKKHTISVPSIKTKISKEGWVKGSLAKKVEEQIEENTIQKLARLGMPEDKILMVLVEGLEATFEKWKKNPNAKEGEPKFDLEIYADHQARAKYLDICNKMTAKYTPQEVKHSGEISIADQIKQKWNK